MTKDEKLKYACMICGETLEYTPSELEQKCVYCGEIDSSPITCPNGHFVCDSCHSSDAIGFMQRLAEYDTSTNPRDIVENCFNHSSFSFHGPEHHSLVPAALLIAMKNRGIKRPDGTLVTEDMILEGIRRGSKIPGGFCGYAGTCGACVGAGVAIALYLGSTPKRAKERTEAHSVTMEAIRLVQDSLVRCCKRSTLYGLIAAMEFMKEKYDIDLGDVPSSGSCMNWHRNRDCEKERCGFHPKDSASS